MVVCLLLQRLGLFARPRWDVAALVVRADEASLDGVAVVLERTRRGSGGGRGDGRDGRRRRGVGVVVLEEHAGGVRGGGGCRAREFDGADSQLFKLCQLSKKRGKWKKRVR